MQITIHDLGESGEYLVRCARIRDITVVKLVRDLLDVIARDQLVLAILDDDGRPRPRERYERHYKDARHEAHQGTAEAGEGGSPPRS
jgi:hypothetical protein